MNTYLFQKASETSVRVIYFEEDEQGYKSVADILEMRYDGSEKGLKFTVKNLYEMVFVGRQTDDENGYDIIVDDAYGKKYDASLEGKARKKSSKEINVISAMLLQSEIRQ